MDKLFNDYDDGNWYWKSDCQYVDNTSNPKDYVYTISFSTPIGGFLSGNEITCRYWSCENLLEIIKKGVAINFYVESFVDIKKILTPMIKSENAIIYKLHETRKPNKERRKKLKQISKLNKLNGN